METTTREQALRELERAARKVVELGMATIDSEALEAITRRLERGARIELSILLAPLRVRGTIATAEAATVLRPDGAERTWLFDIDAGPRLN